MKKAYWFKLAEKIKNITYYINLEDHYLKQYEKITWIILNFFRQF